MSDEVVSVNQRTFDYKIIGINHIIPQTQLDRVDIPVGVQGLEVQTEEVLHGLLVSLRAYVLTDHLEPYVIEKSKTEVVTYFPTWWDHLKHQLRNKWWWPWKKYNVEDTRITMNFRANVFPELVFPDANISYPTKYGRPYKATYYEADIRSSRE